MTPEEQIRELLKHYHSRCTSDMRKRVAVDIVEKIPGLLELVEQQWSRVKDLEHTNEFQRDYLLKQHGERCDELHAAQEEIQRLQEQVRELGSRCTHVDLCPHCGV